MTEAVRQDASMWRDRILGLLNDLDTAHERAMQLRTALRRDEMTKESHDNIVSYCLGKIKSNKFYTKSVIYFLTNKTEQNDKKSSHYAYY